MMEGVGYIALYLLPHAAAHCVPFIATTSETASNTLQG